jgi:ketosteroid isomerase-like protein
VVKEDPMDATDVAQRYFDAWNRRDPEAIVATFAEGGTYKDPNAPEGLSGRAIAEYAAGLFAAFPDLSFDVLSHHGTGDGRVVAR